MARQTRPKTPKRVEALRHVDATRPNIPTAEHQSVVQEELKRPVPVSYGRQRSGLEEEISARNRDLDPQLVWRGKDEQDWSDLVVQAPPLYIQEKVHPKALIDDLLRQSRASAEAVATQTSLFADFNGLPEGYERTDFYRHEGKWQNRMILGDSLQVMASLAEREGLRGKVQCIYIDPPYGIKFNSNFQWSTTSRDVKDGDARHITREPEQVKAFRDTWRDGVHTYLTYLRDRLTVARDLLTESGSIFVQIGDENVHRVRALLDSVFGEENCVTEILVKKKGSQKGNTLDPVNDFILWYGRSKKSSGRIKFRTLYEIRSAAEVAEDFPYVELPDGTRCRFGELEEASVLDGNAVADFLIRQPGARMFAANPLKSGGHRRKQSLPFKFEGRTFPIQEGQCWKHTVIEDDDSTPGMERLAMAGRLFPQVRDVRYVRYAPDPPIREISNWWDGFGGASSPVYVVQTNERVIQRCLLMVTDPGDLVLDPTCGSGTTAYVAEQWGRRWMTIDTSRVALALARARIMGARYPYYLLADSKEGQLKEGEVTQTPPKTTPTYNNVRHGFVYSHAENTTSGSIAKNAEIEIIWEVFRKDLEPLRSVLNAALTKSWEEWEIPREAAADWSEQARRTHAAWWAKRIARQKEIDASIAAKAEYELLYDKPYEDNRTVRVAGPFTVESLSPHRMLSPDDASASGTTATTAAAASDEHDFARMILENLKLAGVQQAAKEDRISFTSLTPWPGAYVNGEGRYTEGDAEKRAGIFIGPEFGTVSRPDLTAAAREAADAGFDVLISCAFAYDAHATELDRLGALRVLKARMNADLHMAGELTGKGNLFVVFGEPDVEIIQLDGDQYQVKVNGVDVFDPNSGEVRSDGPDGIACWFIDTDYDESSFFVRHAYFLGANDPYRSLKTTLKAEIDEDAWASLNSAVSRPFPKPSTGLIAVKVINHLGDEVMKVYRLP